MNDELCHFMEVQISLVHLSAASYTCKTGQIASDAERTKTADNSKDGCAAACNALSWCGAFDFTRSKKNDACRLVNGGRAPQSDGGVEKRQYCRGAMYIVNLYVCMHVCMYVCMRTCVHVCLYVY